MGGGEANPYSLGYVVDDDGAVGVAVVHGRQRLVSLLARRVPNLKFDRGCVVEGYRLREESGADGGFPIVVELVLDETEDERTLLWIRRLVRG